MSYRYTPRPEGMRNGNANSDNEEPLIHRGLQEAHNRAVELVIANMTDKPPAMRGKIIIDLTLAIHGSPQQRQEASERLKKIQVEPGWPAETLQIIIDRLQAVPSSGSGEINLKDKKYQPFHDLFKKTGEQQRH